MACCLSFVYTSIGSVIVTSSNSLHAGDGDGDYRDDLTDDDSDHHDFSSLGMQYTTAVLDLAASQNDGKVVLLTDSWFCTIIHEIQVSYRN